MLKGSTKSQQNYLRFLYPIFEIEVRMTLSSYHGVGKILRRVEPAPITQGQESRRWSWLG